MNSVAPPLLDAPSETPLAAPAQAVMAQAVIDLEREYLLQNYARYPLVLGRGKGCYVYDLAGKRYLDFISGIGVNALGYAHPRLTKVIREQAALLIHTSNLYYHQYQGPLAKRLAQMSGLQRCFFANTGTEAMEGAFNNRAAGIVLEMIQGEGGINPLTPEFVAKARALADRYNALLVADETQWGL